LLATFESKDCFPIRGLSIRGGIAEEVKFPTSNLLFKKLGSEHDLLLFIGEEQPILGKEWEFSNELLELAEQYGAKVIYTFAAMPKPIHHRASPKVWGVVTEEHMLEVLDRHQIRSMTEGSITGLNGSIQGIASDRGWRGLCLLGEIPLYTTQIANPKASLSIIDKLSQLLKFSIDLEELKTIAMATDTQLDQVIQQVRSRIDETEPEPEPDYNKTPKNKKTLLN
jgi:predicted ATP-grasp superfamily ATP-dependent carboligase